ncbi:MAG: hypothetical protein ACXVCP_02460 [Bdellovibrio sp.]
MLKKILLGFICIILVVAVNRFVVHFVGSDDETIFKIGGCLRDDEMGVTYRVHGTAKGSLGAEVISSEKYPSSDAYKIGTKERLPLDKNPRKLYPIKCP